jgi:homoserine O-succinyltransferase/O-acetyltransferase
VSVEVESPPAAGPGGKPRDTHGDSRSSRITIGLINNMPDSALVGTERQFLRLLTEAATGHDIAIRLGSLPEVQRGDVARARIAENYWSLADLISGELDALIVTGSEPRAPVLEDEPYWGAMTQLLKWADAALVSSVWSCLAAHMAVRTLDGIQRRPLPNKMSGVYDFHVRHSDSVVRSTSGRIRTPHSRWNGLRGEDLVARGYRVLTTSDDGQVDTFIRDGRSLLVFCQGHPEYLEDTLLREYRRDVQRFLSRERPGFPRLPDGYLSEEGQALAAEFERSVLADPVETGAARFPFDRLAREVRRDWFEDAAALYRNWLNEIANRRGRRLEE